MVTEFETISKMTQIILTGKGTREHTWSPANYWVSVGVLPWWCNHRCNRVDSGSTAYFWKLENQFVAIASSWMSFKGTKLSERDLLRGRGLRGWRLGLVPTGWASWTGAGASSWACIEDHSSTCVWRKRRENKEYYIKGSRSYLYLALLWNSRWCGLIHP